MNEPLRILILEDSESDVLLICRELEKCGIAFEHHWIQSAADYKTAIDEEQWDVILSDYSMGQFTGLDALNIMKERELDYPFIILSGTIGEDIAVAAMHAGAQDYIMKDNLARLVPAICRELREAERMPALAVEIKANIAAVESSIIPKLPANTPAPIEIGATVLESISGSRSPTVTKITAV